MNWPGCAFAVVDTFLRLNGYRLALSDDDAYDMTMRLAEGKIDKVEMANVLREDTVPIER